jgi:hypothetical protein
LPHGEKSTSDWQVFQLKGTNRTFVVYTAKQEFIVEHHVYEIDKNAKVDKLIIADY